MNGVKAFFAVLGVILLTAALAVGAWQLGWFVEEKNTDRQVHIDNRNTGTQTAWRDEAVKTVADYYLVPEGHPEATGALRTKACGLIGRLRSDYLTPDLESFYAKEC